MSTPIVTPNTLHVTWDPVKPMERRGYIIQYNVISENLLHEWQELHDVIIQEFNVSLTNLLLEQLDNFTDYHVTVKAATKVGYGPSTNAMFRTAENGMCFY